MLYRPAIDHDDPGLRGDLARVQFNVRAKLIKFAGDVVSHIIMKGTIEIDEDLVFGQVENLAPQLFTPPTIGQVPSIEADAWKALYAYRGELTDWEQKMDQIGTAAEFVDRIVMK